MCDNWSNLVGSACCLQFDGGGILCSPADFYLRSSRHLLCRQLFRTEALARDNELTYDFIHEAFDSANPAWHSDAIQQLQVSGRCSRLQVHLAFELERLSSAGEEDCVALAVPVKAMSAECWDDK